MASDSNASRKTRFALLGAGFIGNVHARSLADNPLVDFACVSDADSARAEQLALQYGTRAATLDQAFDLADAVLIASSTNTHAELLERAARAGKAVYCEKPIDLDLKRARSAVEVARQAGVPVALGFNRRYDESHAAVKAAVGTGEVGKIEMVQMSNRGPSLPPIAYVKVSGGQMRDQTVHFFDLLRWLTADEPVEVYVSGAALASPAFAEVGDVDTSIAVLRMKSGAICQIDSTRRSGYGYDERIEVYGAEGLLESRRQTARSMTLYKGDRMVSDGLYAGWFERMQPTYARLLDAFVRHLHGAPASFPTLDDGLRAQAIAEAATESLKTGKPVAI